MFRTLSFPFSRIFRLRRRRGAKVDASSVNVPLASYSAPPPPPRSYRPISSPPKPINTAPTTSTRRRTLFISSLLSPIHPSPPPSYPDVSPLPPGTPTPVLIIGPDLPQSTLPLPPAPPGPVGPQVPVDGVSLLESPPAPNSRRVSFQLPTTHTQERPESPLSTCSTLVTEVGEHREVELTSTVPPEQPPAPEAGPIEDASVDVELVAELPSVACSGSAKARHRSLFSPQPVRVDVSRFSLPIASTASRMTASANANDSRRDSKRTSITPQASGSGSTKKEKRTSRWSRELSKPETQEVLRALAYRAF